MAVLSILNYPDQRLHTIAKPVASVDARIQQIVADMAETMYEASGIGLAATQVDIHERIIVIDTSEERDALMVFINPELIWASPIGQQVGACTSKQAPSSCLPKKKIFQFGSLSA
ncbi:MAG: hypothetical protein EBV55_06455 [Burkholderiaceae bacterium]|nr:hypothetical protein [Burkholderiaceae bacterium]